MNIKKLKDKLHLNKSLQEKLDAAFEEIHPLLKDMGLLSSEQVGLLRNLLSFYTDLEYSLISDEIDMIGELSKAIEDTYKK